MKLCSSDNHYTTAPHKYQDTAFISIFALLTLIGETECLVTSQTKIPALDN